MSAKIQNQRANDAYASMLSDVTVCTKTSTNPYIAEFYRNYGHQAGSWDRLMSPRAGDKFFCYSLNREYEVPFEEWTISVYEIVEEGGFLYTDINGKDCILIPTEESWTSWRGNSRTHRYCQVITLSGEQLDSIWFTPNWGGPEDVEVKQPYSIMDVVYFLFHKEIDNLMECKKFRYEYYCSNSGKTTEFKLVPCKVKFTAKKAVLSYIETLCYWCLNRITPCGCEFYIHGGVSPKMLVELSKQSDGFKTISQIVRTRKMSKTSSRRKFHREKLQVLKYIRQEAGAYYTEMVKYDLISERPDNSTHNRSFVGADVISVSKETLENIRIQNEWCELFWNVIDSLVAMGVAKYPEKTIGGHWTSQDKEHLLIRVNAIRNKNFACYRKELVLLTLSLLGY